MARNLAVATEFRGFDRMSKPLRNITNKLDKIDRRLKRTKKVAKETSGSFVKSFNRIAGGIAVALIAFKGFRVVKETIFSTTRAASDFFEENQKFGVVFRGVSSEANKMRDVLVKSYNFSRLEATQLLAATGDLLVSQGFTRKESAAMAFELNKLAADRASFTNLEGGAARASRILTKALIGEREGLKSIGLAVTSTTQVFKEQFKVGLKVRKGNIDQAKAIATWNIVLKQSADSLGDVARNQGTYASNLRLMESRTSDLEVAIGEALLPTMNILLGQFLQGSVALGQFAEANKGAISNLFIDGLIFIIKGFSVLVRLIATVVIIFKGIQIAFSQLVSIAVSGISLLLEGFVFLGKGVGKVFGFILEKISGVLSSVLTGAAAVAAVFDDELAVKIKKAQDALNSFSGDAFSKKFDSMLEGPKKLSKSLDDFNVQAKRNRTELLEDMETIAVKTNITERAIENFSKNLDKARNQAAIDNTATQTIVQPEKTDPVGNATPSASITTTANIKGALNINFNNKPDNVEVVKPSGKSNIDLVIGTSG